LGEWGVVENTSICLRGVPSGKSIYSRRRLSSVRPPPSRRNNKKINKTGPLIVVVSTIVAVRRSSSHQTRGEGGFHSQSVSKPLEMVWGGGSLIVLDLKNRLWKPSWGKGSKNNKLLVTGKLITNQREGGFLGRGHRSLAVAFSRFARKALGRLGGGGASMRSVRLPSKGAFSPNSHPQGARILVGFRGLTCRENELTRPSLLGERGGKYQPPPHRGKRITKVTSLTYRTIQNKPPLRGGGEISEIVYLGNFFSVVSEFSLQ